MTRQSDNSAAGRTKRPAIGDLARALGIPPNQTVWLEQALTHRSFTRDTGNSVQENNERLEFLGDAVAQLVVTLILYESYPLWQEGQLTRARSALVSREPMVRAAKRLQLGGHLRLGRTEEKQGERQRPSILASAFEAVIAAVYLTSGMNATSSLIRTALGPEIATVEMNARNDSKTQLQEHCQAEFHATPEYRIVSSNGPDHDRNYTAEVCVHGEIYGTGTGHSKRDAEQNAANEAIDRLNQRLQTR